MRWGSSKLAVVRSAPPELLAGEALGEEVGAQQEASRLPPRQRAVCACLALGFGLGTFRL